MRWFFYIVAVIIITAVPLLSRWRVKGRENIPKQGPLLVVVNHLHLADPPLVGLGLGRKAKFMAKEELFRSKIIGYFLSGLGAFPVHRGQMDREALRQAERVLSEGYALVMFPESTRSKNARLQAAYSGAALIALRSNAPVLPLAITGTERIKGATWWLRRPRITINAGHPFNLPQTNGKVSKAKLAEHTDLIMGHIAELLPEEYQGNYYRAGNTDDTEG